MPERTRVPLLEFAETEYADRGDILIYAVRHLAAYCDVLRCILLSPFLLPVCSLHTRLPNYRQSPQI